MINFKKNVQIQLPYDRAKYIEYLEDDVESTCRWYGVSFQLPDVFEGKDIGLEVFLENYEDWFKNIIEQLDNGSSWIINHDTYDVKWFPNRQNNLKTLRALFRKNHIRNTFKGGVILMKDELLKYTKDIISYPYGVCNRKGYLYENLDISHKQLSFIIKISGHLTIDLLSLDKELLKRIVNENSSNQFIIRKYRGTEL